MSWLEDARRVSLSQVTAELDIKITRDGHLSPCPSCGERARSKSDSRPGPVFLTSQGARWRCGRCGARGDGVDLVSLLECRQPFGKASSPAVRAWFAARGWCEEAPGATPAERRAPRPPRPLVIARPVLPPSEARALWDACPRLQDAPEAIAWVQSRALAPEVIRRADLVRGVPPGELPRFASHWRRFGVVAVLPLFNAAGELAGLQGRAMGGARKSVRMRAVACSGLLLASAAARRLLETGVPPGKGIPLEVVEGEPDFLSVLAKRPGAALLGIPGAGAWTEGIAARVPDGARVEVATHQDGTGEGYARLVRHTLNDRCELFRMRWTP